MTVLGPVIEKQQKIVNDCVEKKLQLSKLQSGIWQKESVGGKEEPFILTDMDEDLLKNLIDKDISKEGGYKLS